MMRIERRDLEELLTRLIGIIDAVWQLAKDHMAQKDH